MDSETTADACGSPSSWLRRNWEIFAVAAVLCLAWVWRVWAGAENLPVGDAWAYERIFDTFHMTGAVRLVGWNDITLVGMLPVTEAWVSVVGYGSTQLHLLGVVAALVALAGVRSLLVTYRARHRAPVLLTLACTSGFVGISGTYLSDGFAAAGAIWAVALASRVAMTAGPFTTAMGALTGISALCASYGFMVRQQMLVGALGAAFILWNSPTVRRVAVPLFAGLFLVVSTPAYLWRSGLEHGGEIELLLKPRGVVESLGAFYIEIGLVLACALLWLHRRPAVSARQRWMCAIACFGLASVVLAAWSLAKPAHPLLLGLRQEFPRGGAIGTFVIVCVATTAWFVSALQVASAARLGTRVLLRQLHPVAKVALIGLIVELVVIVSTGAYYPRYSIFFLATAAVAFAATQRLAVRPSAIVGTCLLAASSFWQLDHSVASIGALDSAAAITRCLGITDDRLDGGFSWVGNSYTGIADSDPNTIPRPDGLPMTDARAIFHEMERDAVLLPSDPGLHSAWTVIGPLQSGGRLPGYRQSYWLVIRTTSTTSESLVRCASVVDQELAHSANAAL